MGSGLRRLFLGTLLAVLAGTATTGCGTDRPEDATPVIFSTDLAMGLDTGSANGTVDDPPNVDDAWAYALAEANDGIDVRGLVVTMGNAQLAPELPMARRTVEALGRYVPVAQGASVWLPPAPNSDYTGASLADTCVNEGVRFMADELRDTEDLTIIAIGPLTDLACLTLNYPDEAAGIGEIVALVGSAPGPLIYNGHTLRDFNYAMDPRAAQILLEDTEIPFTAITFEASSSAAIATRKVDKLARSDDELASFFGRASLAHAEFWRRAIAPGQPTWDANAVWYLLHPEAYECGPAGFRLRLGVPNSAADSGVTDWFSPAYIDTREVTACTAFTDRAAIHDFKVAVLEAVGGGG